MLKKQTGIYAVLLLLLFSSLLLFACRPNGNAGNGTTDGEQNSGEPPAPSGALTVFDGSGYTAAVIYPSAGSGAGPARSEISSALRKQFGAVPKFEKDSESEADPDRVEILLGNTNRPESARPEEYSIGDAWYFVGVSGNKIVISGANDYMLGLAAERFITDFIQPSNGKLVLSPEQNLTLHWEDYCSVSWPLDSLPYYKDPKAVISYAPYRCGTTILSAGDLNPVEVKMAIASGTSSEAFEDYIRRLQGFGFAMENRTAVEKNAYVTLFNGQDRVYVYYTGNTETVNIIIDNASTPAADFSYTVKAEENKGAEFYLYGLNMNPLDHPDSGFEGYPNNGMLLVIRCADNSVMIFDGGNESQMTGIGGEGDAPMVQLNRFLHQITGKGENEKITISCWFLSHAHRDHSGGFYDFLRTYASGYTLERICTNLPAYGTFLSSAEKTTLDAFSRLVKRNWPDCKEIKLHTGQSVQIADVTLQALYTHEDNVDPMRATSKLSASKLNDTCTIVKVSTEHMSMMVLGDADTDAENVLVKMFTAETLKCDMVQVAHHGFNSVTRIYNAVQARIALFPQSYGYMQRWVDPLVDINKRNVTKAVSKYADVIRYAGNFSKTVGFAYVDGAIREIYNGADQAQADAPGSD